MNTFPLVEVSGTSYEMGRQHGEQAVVLIEAYLTLIERTTRMSRDTLCRGAMRYEPYIKALSADFLAEVRGLGDGAGISYEEAMLCQVRAEAAASSEGASLANREGCTAFAIWGPGTVDGALVIGQNQDMPPEYDEVSIVLRVSPSDGRPACVMRTFAGQLGYFGLNEHGVTNWANSLYDYHWQAGIAHYPLKRVAMEQCTCEQVIDLYRDHPQCSAANTLISDGSGAAVSIESRPGQIALYRGQQPGMIVHTNHYLTSEFAHHETHSLPDSVTRHDRMLALLCERWGEIDTAYLKHCLADHQGDPAGICRHGERGIHTTSGYIAEPQRGVLHVRRGHGCLGQWESYAV